MLNASSEIHDMYGRYSVASIAYDWQRSELLMERKPSSSKEFVKHSVSLSITVE